MPETPTSWDSLYDDERQQRQVDNTRTRQQLMRHHIESNPRKAEQVAKIAGSLRKTWPHMTPGAAMALAQGGYGPDSDVAKEVARRAGLRKVKRGIGWHSIGDALGRGVDIASGVADFVTPEKVEDAVGATLSTAGKAVKPVTRAAFTAAETPWQEVQGQFRRIVTGDIAGAARWGLDVATGHLPDDPESSGGIALRHLARGEHVDLGSGYLPGGAIEDEQSEAARSHGLIGGHAITPGRWTASKITEPGTAEYNLLSGLIDATAVLALDPVDKGLGKLSEVRNARKLFSEGRVVDHLATGLVPAVRKTTIPEVAQAWVHGKDGRKVVSWLAKTNSPYEVFKMMKGKVSVETAAALAAAPDERSVLEELSPRLGTWIREKPYVANAVTRPFKPVAGFGDHLPDLVTRRIDSVRMLHSMPGTNVDLEDATEFATQVERWMRNAKLPDEMVRARFDQAARAGDRIERFRVLTDTMDDTMKALVPHATPGQAKAMTRLFREPYEELSRYFVDEVGHNAPVLGAVVDGTAHALPSPHLFNEYIDRVVPLPDAREVRRATSAFGRLLNKPGLKLAAPTLDWFQQDIWKPLVLLRGAWTVRVVGEEQVRMGAAGLESVASHPLSAIAWVTGRRGAADVLGESFDASDDLTDFARSLSHRGGGWNDPWRDRKVRLGKTLYRREDERFAESWADELAQLHHDPVAKRVAGGWSAGDKIPGGATGNHVDDAKRWFWDGPGKTFRGQLANAKGKEVLGVDRQAADDYIDSIFQRIRIKTGEDPELMDAIATGQFGDEAISADRKLSKKLKQSLQARAENGIGPEVVKGGLALSVGKGTEFKDRAVSGMFNVLMSRPTNYLSRSPAFKQYYWKRIEELMPFLTREAQEEAIRAAKGAGLQRAKKLTEGLPDQFTPGLRNLAKRMMRGTGDLALTDADVIAKGHALDQTKHLLYDLSERSQFFDIARHVFPFGEAWKEVLTRWAGLVSNDPRILRRGQLAIEGGRGSGFFHSDPQTGEEMFSFPGAEFITEKALGVPVPLEGSVAGLNLFSNNPLMPGLGPIAQIPIKRLIPDTPEWDDMRHLLLPYGTANGEDGLIERYMPGWVQRFRQAAGQGDQRLYTNTVIDVMRYLASTGKYDLTTATGMEKLEDDAKRKAKGLYMIRGAAQFFAPTAPTPRFMAIDKNGDTQLAFMLVDRFRELQEQDYETAPEKFLDQFGENAFLFMQSKTQSGGGPAPASKEGLDWVREHGDLVRRYPEAYGYFAPQGGDFDYTAYQRLIANGDIKPLTPKEYLRLANHRVASMVYRNYRDQAGARPTEEQRIWLGRLREALLAKYPGYEPIPRDMGATDREMRDLIAAVNDSELGSTPVGQTIQTYLAQRQRVIDAVGEGNNFRTAKRYRVYRDWLRNVLATLTEREPAFAEVRDRLFEREMSDDTE